MLAVIIVNFNSGDWLGRCLLGMASQSIRPDFITIVDNNSTDASLEIAEAVEIEYRIIKADKNLGFAAANNLASQLHPDCRWIVLLNPDTIPEPDWLEKLVEYAEAHPECGAVGSLMTKADDNSILDGIGDAYHGSGLAWRLGHGKPRSEVDLGENPVFSPSGAAVLYNKELFERLGGFDESFFCYYEDIDLGFRIRLAGYACGFAPHSIVRHAGSAITGKRSDFTVYHGHRNMVWTFVKNTPGWLFWFYLPHHLFINSAFVLLCIFRGQMQVILRAKRDAIRGLPEAWRKRREIQQGRKACIQDIRKAMTPNMLDWFRTRRY